MAKPSKVFYQFPVSAAVVVLFFKWVCAQTDNADSSENGFENQLSSSNRSKCLSTASWPLTQRNLTGTLNGTESEMEAENDMDVILRKETEGGLIKIMFNLGLTVLNDFSHEVDFITELLRNGTDFSQLGGNETVGNATQAEFQRRYLQRYRGRDIGGGLKAPILNTEAASIAKIMADKKANKNGKMSLGEPTGDTESSTDITQNSTNSPITIKSWSRSSKPDTNASKFEAEKKSNLIIFLARCLEKSSK